MLTKWSVSNFKSIRTTRVINSDETTSDELTFKPLTIFCGANSSGKSSLIQSILLLAQTMRFEDKKYPLILNGMYTSLGRFSDILSKPGAKKNVKIKFTLSPPSLVNHFNQKDYPFWFFAKSPVEINFTNINFEAFFNKCKKSEVFPELFRLELSVSQSLKSKYILECKKNNEVFILKDKFVGPEFRKKGFLTYKILPELNHFLPNQFYFERIDAICERILYNIYDFPNETKYFGYSLDDMNKIVPPSYFTERIPEETFDFIKKLILSKFSITGELFNIKHEECFGKLIYCLDDWKKNIRSLPLMEYRSLKKFLEDNLQILFDKVKENVQSLANFIYEETINLRNEAKGKRIPNDWEQELLVFSSSSYSSIPFYPSPEIIFKRISSYFSNYVFYIAPLREDPKSVYSFSETTYTLDIGKKGENTAATLALYGNNVDSFPVPDWDNKGEFKEESKSLNDSVKEWLNYIGVAVDFIASVEKSGYVLKVKSSENTDFTDLNNVGVGVSQVLPIVVRCLFTLPFYPLILIEQPELHLHPKMQTRLANFFIAISYSGRQCIIETHSEHFINALRYRIALLKSPNDDKLANDIQIYFTEKDDEGTLFKAININKYSAVSDWPEGFFDESHNSAKGIIDEFIKKMDSEDIDE